MERPAENSLIPTKVGKMLGFSGEKAGLAVRDVRVGMGGLSPLCSLFRECQQGPI